MEDDTPITLAGGSRIANCEILHYRDCHLAYYNLRGDSSLGWWILHPLGALLDGRRTEPPTPTLY